MKEKEVRQSIIMRVNFPDGKGGTKKLRRGKEISQGSHSSGAFLARRLRDNGYVKLDELSPEMQQWLNGEVTKICLKVESEEEILQLFHEARERGLESHIITDAGKTEFNGVPTITSLSIGPNYREDIDPITKHLKLY